MSASGNLQDAVDVLQELGLKEYEARCFVGLSRLEYGTAKRLSEITEVPRTRVYDAIRVLEARGLVEIQHSSPQRFRAVALDEATETLQDQYDDRVERLHNALEPVEIEDPEGEAPVHQVWAMSGRDAIENRANQLISTASDEIVFVLGEKSLLTQDLIDALNEGSNGVDLLIGTVSTSLQEEVRSKVPTATAYVSGLDWLRGEEAALEHAAIGRLLLIDRSTVLVSSITPDTGEERAVFGQGFGNGLIVIARRLMAEGLLTERDPN